MMNLDCFNASCFNCSNNNNSSQNCSDAGGFESASTSGLMLALLSSYGIIFVLGSVGNGLVIFVVLRYAKMRSVTNTYILNLAISDFLFIIGLPFLITTGLRKSWIFGNIMCKIFYVLTSLNWFTSVFILTVLSIDRYLAVCQAIWSMAYRQIPIARLVSSGVWVVSLLVMLPIFIYSEEVEMGGVKSCTITWPDNDVIDPYHAFIFYSFCLGFAIPVTFISVFYLLVVLRLRKVGPRNSRTKNGKRDKKRVTSMVLAVITVYIICWLPYWIFQMVALWVEQLPEWSILLYQLLTILSYANSALNPLLYAFLSENFRRVFWAACFCRSPASTSGPTSTTMFGARSSTNFAKSAMTTLTTNVGFVNMKELSDCGMEGNVNGCHFNRREDSEDGMEDNVEAVELNHLQN